MVRNFWIDVDVEGRKTGVGTGPRGKLKGFRAKIYIRDKGNISAKQVLIEGEVAPDGRLLLTVSLLKGAQIVRKVLQLRTRR